MENNKINDQKVQDMSYDIFEKILTSIDYQTKEELTKLTEIMLKKVQDEKYPEVLRQAYAEASRKIDILSLDQLNEIKKIITSD